MNRRSLLIVSGLAAAAPLLGRPAFAQGAQITGAGATFPDPVYQMGRGRRRPRPASTVNYQSIGSGGGQNQITQPHGGFRRLRRADDAGAS